MPKENLLAADYVINRYYFRRVAAWLVPAFAKTPATPNEVTALAFGAGLGCVASFWTGHYLIGAILIHVQLVLDTCDGGLARYKDSVTRFGAKLDATLDTVLWFLIFLGLALGAGIEVYLLIGVWITLIIHLLITRVFSPNAAKNMPKVRWFNKWFHKRNLRFGFDEVLMLVMISLLAPFGFISAIFWVAIIGRNLDWIYRVIETEDIFQRGRSLGCG